MRYENGEWRPRWYDKIPFARLTTILATTAGICFGLCFLSVTVGAGIENSLNQGNYSISGIIASVIASIEALCVLGLIVLGILALVGKIQRYFDTKPQKRMD